jgi:SulP family sulfate permease
VLALVSNEPDVRALLLDMEATSQLDTTSIDMLEQLLAQLKERDVELYLVRVFYRARQVLRRSGFIEELGHDRMWHSISAGVRAARAQVNVTGKAHPQLVDADDDLSYADTDERIAVDVEAPAGSGDDDAMEAPDAPRAPKGGYQDPDNRSG